MQGRNEVNIGCHFPYAMIRSILAIIDFCFYMTWFFQSIFSKAYCIPWSSYLMTYLYYQTSSKFQETSLFISKTLLDSSRIEFQRLYLFRFELYCEFQDSVCLFNWRFCFFLSLKNMISSRSILFYRSMIYLFLISSWQAVARLLHFCFNLLISYSSTYISWHFLRLLFLRFQFSCLTFKTSENYLFKLLIYFIFQLFLFSISTFYLLKSQTFLFRLAFQAKMAVIQLFLRRYIWFFSVVTYCYDFQIIQDRSLWAVFFILFISSAYFMSSYFISHESSQFFYMQVLFLEINLCSDYLINSIYFLQFQLLSSNSLLLSLCCCFYADKSDQRDRWRFLCQVNWSERRLCSYKRRLYYFWYFVQSYFDVFSFEEYFYQSCFISKSFYVLIFSTSLSYLFLYKTYFYLTRFSYFSTTSLNFCSCLSNYLVKDNSWSLNLARLNSSSLDCYLVCESQLSLIFVSYFNKFALFVFNCQFQQVFFQISIQFFKIRVSNFQIFFYKLKTLFKPDFFSQLSSYDWLLNLFQSSIFELSLCEHTAWLLTQRSRIYLRSQDFLLCSQLIQLIYISIKV